MVNRTPRNLSHPAVFDISPHLIPFDVALVSNESDGEDINNKSIELEDKVVVLGRLDSQGIVQE